LFNIIDSIVRFLENGIYEKWTKDMYDSVAGFNNIGKESKRQFEVFNLENAKSALTVFYIGIATSIIGAIFEAFPHFLQVIFNLIAIIKFRLSTAWRNL